MKTRNVRKSKGTPANADSLSPSKSNSPNRETAYAELPNITMRRVDKLIAHKNNARTHPPEQIRRIADSIGQLDFLEPVLVDAKGVIIAGHGRVEAAKLLEMTTVPTICIDHLTPEQIKAARITLNRLAELAGWDEDLLRIDLGELIECDFDVELTGFDTADIDILFQDSDAPDTDPTADRLPDLDPAQPPVSKLGYRWLMDGHCLLCGDATEEEAFKTLMAGELAQMVITDPPYNVPIHGNVCGSGAIKHQEFPMASGEMSETKFTDFLSRSTGHLVAYSLGGSIHYLFMDWRHLPELYAATFPHYGRPKNLVVWNKDNAGMGTFYRSKHELVIVFKNGTAKHINNFELGQKGRYRSNVWNYPGQNSFHKGRQEELSLHPTVKPVAMIADAIRDCSKIGGIVLDCFGGSGTTIIAAEKTNRRAYVMELDPHYVDTAIRRWQAFTGKDAVLESTGCTFAEEEVRHE